MLGDADPVAFSLSLLNTLPQPVREESLYLLSLIFNHLNMYLGVVFFALILLVLRIGFLSLLVNDS